MFALSSLPRALLAEARGKLHEDGPRLVLADWLEDHGHGERAEFLRLQLRLASGGLTSAKRRPLAGRCRLLLRHRGGCWLGPLWQWHPRDYAWHRGLLSVRLPSRFDPELVTPLLPWVDALTFDVAGKSCLRRAVALLSAAGVNHVVLELRQAFRESFLRDALADIPESACLRSLAFNWPLAMLRPGESGNVPSVSAGFLDWLLGECPAGTHLSHLASSFPFEGAELVRGHGVEPVHARERFWHHAASPSFVQPAAALVGG